MSTEDCRGPSDVFAGDATSANEFHTAARRIYLSRILSQFTNRLLQFVIPMMFITLWTETFVPTALLAFSTYATHFFILPYCGALMDAAHRRRAASVLITIKSLCNAFALLSLYATYRFEMGGATNPDFSTGHVGFATCCILFIVGETAEESWTLSLERNWVVILCRSDEDLMTMVNVAIRRIDLGCLTVAPLVFGFVLQYSGSTEHQLIAGTLVTGIVFLLTWTPELRFAQSAYDNCEALRHVDGDGAHTSTRGLLASKSNVVGVLMGSWSRYTRHRVFWASFAYSMIYFTVLDGGSVMLSFLKWSGVSETVIGLSRGAGAAMGLAGSALFAPVKRSLGDSLERTGVLSIWLFWLILAPVGVAAVAFSDSTLFGYVLVGCVAAARCALWLFDLDHTLIMQAYLDDGERAELNGAQSALYRVFWVLLSVVVLVVSDPHQFRSLALLSLAVVAGACIIFTAWASGSGLHQHAVKVDGASPMSPPTGRGSGGGGFTSCTTTECLAEDARNPASEEEMKN